MKVDCCWLELNRSRQRIKLFAAGVALVHLDIHFFSVPLPACSVANNMETGL